MHIEQITPGVLKTTRTVSPPREATWLITEGGLSSEFTSRGLCSENVFHMTGESGS